MPRYVAEKPFQLYGTQYSAGEVVDAGDFARLTVDKRRRLVEQRFVSADRVVVRDEPAGESAGDALVRVVHKTGKWYDVVVGGEVVNDKGMAKDEADALADEYRADLGLEAAAAV